MTGKRTRHELRAIPQRLDRGRPRQHRYKGIAIRLDEGRAASKGNKFVVFETDTLRMAARPERRQVHRLAVSWYDGSHGTHPKIAGERMFTNPVAPGWAKPGTDSFEDPCLRGLDKNLRPAAP